MSLPAQYAWLEQNLAANAGHPRMIAEAVRLFGTHEGDGTHKNPVIMGWVKEIAALPGKYSVVSFTNDHLEAWCGLFMAHVAHAANKDFPDHPLWALNWAGFGRKSPEPSLGDVLVFYRKPAGGHVGIYVGEDADAFHVLGGNEANRVNIVRIEKSRIAAVRRPLYDAMPVNVVPIRLTNPDPHSPRGERQSR